MKKFLLCFALFSLIACSKEFLGLPDSGPTNNADITRSTHQVKVNDESKAQRFTEHMLRDLIRNSSFKGDYTVETDVKVRASTTPGLYVVNFEDGGWMIVAGHVRNENQVLAYSETGSFKPSSITNPGVRLWYELTKSQMEDVEIVEQAESSSISAASVASVSSVIDMEQEYYWARLPLPVTTVVLDQGYVAPRLNTKWGQQQPWNSKTPSPSGSSYCYTGCVAVSCAQILYYLQQTKNFDIGLYDVTGTFSNSGIHTYYSINHVNRTNYQPNSNKWDGMRKSVNTTIGNTDEVAELMFDIAEHAGMRFYSTKSVAPISTALFEQYDVICDESDYDFNIVRNSLDQTMPVEVSCFPTSGSGHSWIIDGYKVYETRTDQAYQWKTISTDSLSYYNNLDYDYVFTESQKQLSYPDVEDGQIDHNYSYYRDNYLLMNWGCNGANDDGYYSINANWTANGVNFWKNAKIIHNFRQQ